MDAQDVIVLFPFSSNFAYSALSIRERAVRILGVRNLPVYLLCKLLFGLKEAWRKLHHYRGSRTFLLTVLLTVLGVQLLFSMKIATSQTVGIYYPTGYDLLGATTYVSGALADLQSDDGVYMAFRSYASQTSAQTLYVHQETTTIGGASYYLLKLESAETAGIDLSTSMASAGRQVWGKFVYPLTGIRSIPASTWTFYYRAWHSSTTVTNSPSSVPASTWDNPNRAYSSDNEYAWTDIDGATQQYGSYGFNIPPTANVTKVEVGYEAYTNGNEKIGITLSWDDGNTWATEDVSPPLGTTDPDTLTWVDFTAATNWTADKLSDANFLTRVKANQQGGGMDKVNLDWIPTRVTYVAPPSAHADVDILVRKSDGTIRQTIATDVANSANLTITAQTLSGTYSWPAYTVVDETDYLEIDYYLDVTTANPGTTAYLRIDDDTLALTDQTRTTNIMLPSEYTVEVEFTGSSNTDYWSQLTWTVDTVWTTGTVSVTLQLYNYALDAYPTSGDGYITYISSATSNTDETKSQTITTNPTNFRDTSGNWKMKIKGVKSTTAQFDFKADLIKYETTSVPPPDVAILNVTRSSTSVYPGEIVRINVTVKSEGGTTETFNVTIYYDTAQIGKQTVSSLAPGANTTLTFNWNTTGISSGIYAIKAIADTVSDETDTADNTYLDGYMEVKATPPFDWNQIIPFLLPIVFGLITFLVAGIIRRKRVIKPMYAGFDFFDEITGGGIPDASSVMIIGGPSSGKSMLCQQLTYNYLTKGKSCIYVTYDSFPDEIRKNMKHFHWETSSYENKRIFQFIDCYSSIAGVTSKEKHHVRQPFELSGLGIIMSTALDDVKEKSNRVFLDSTTPLFTRLESSNVIRFLQDRGARIKGDNGIFFFTVGKGTISSNLSAMLEGIVDCIIELDVRKEEGKTLRRLRIRKLRGRRFADIWVSFKIESEKGLVFTVPKDWSKIRT